MNGRLVELYNGLLVEWLVGSMVLLANAWLNVLFDKMIDWLVSLLDEQSSLVECSAALIFLTLKMFP